MADDKIQKDTVSKPKLENIQQTGQEPRQDQKDPTDLKAQESRAHGSAQRLSPGRMPLFRR